MEIGLLLYGIVDLHKKRLVDQLLDTANGEMRHKVLTVTEIAQLVEGIKNVGLKVEQGLGLVVHAEPEHTWRVVAAKEPRAVEVHRERLMVFGHLTAGLDDVGDVLARRLADEL